MYNFLLYFCPRREYFQNFNHFPSESSSQDAIKKLKKKEKGLTE